MNLPTFKEYNTAVQNPARAFTDPELQTGQVRKNGLGLPVVISGGFVLTYTVTCGAKKYAVRCFHKEAPDLTQRYEAISSTLARLSSPYFVDFEYQKEGIKVKGKKYPLVKMEWVQDQTLGEFVSRNYTDDVKIGALNKALSSLDAFLEKNCIAHGDISPGNLMVSDDGSRVRLIDYDGMYIPEIKNLGMTDLGLRGFQHPGRDAASPWDYHVDRFPFILLQTALSALGKDPSLWQASKSSTDKFLFSANDLADPGNSDIFKRISKIEGLEKWASAFANLCRADFTSIPSPSDFFNGFISVDLRPGTGASPSGYISVYPVLDPLNYNLCLRHVGDKVELIGQVIDVRHGRTKYGAPYVFLNFSDWQGEAVKITAWSEYIEANRDKRFHRLMGEYISVTGLLEPPYTSATHDYTHINISLNSTTSFNVIDEAEADYRLKASSSINSAREGEAQYGAKKDGYIPCPDCGRIITDRSRNQIVKFTCGGCDTRFSYDKQKDSYIIMPKGKTSPYTRNANIVNQIERAILNQEIASGKTILCCPDCGRKVAVPPSKRAVSVKCPYCKALFDYDNQSNDTFILTDKKDYREANKKIMENLKKEVFTSANGIYNRQS